MKEQTPDLVSAIEAEIIHFRRTHHENCRLESVEVEALPNLPEGWVRLYCVLRPDNSTVALHGDAGDILTAFKKRKGGIATTDGAEYFWKTLGDETPPRLRSWPDARLFWSSPPDENNGRHAIYEIPQNKGLRFLAGYEGPGFAADDGVDFSDLAGTPTGAADKGFPPAWKEQNPHPWDQFANEVPAESP